MKLEQTADGSYTLYVPELDEHYHSVKGALTESLYNDVCGNYQYYQYRYAGMLIGSIGRDRTPVKANLICDNVDVYIGPWADYYYCEFEKNSSASYTEDFQFSRVEEREIVFDLQGKAISCIHQHTQINSFQTTSAARLWILFICCTHSI